MPGKPKGLPKTGGRKKGTPNKVVSKTREQLWAYINENNKTNPLEFLIDTVHDKTIEYALRVQCAKEVSGYLSAKIKAIDPETGSAEKRIRVIVELSGSD